MVDNVTHVPVITLDGPSGTGKGTLCHRLAEALGWHVFDSGVLYRALGLLTEKRGILLEALDDVVDLAHKLPIIFDQEGILLDGERVGDALRTEVCGARASKLAAIPEVRAALLERQRAFAQHPGLEGFDQALQELLRADNASKSHHQTCSDKGSGGFVLTIPSLF
jgi:cytidylate kinase